MLKAARPQILTRATGFKQQRFQYERPADGENDPHGSADLALTKRVAQTLERHYPSHPWMVEVSHAQGVVMISLPIIMKRNQKFVLHVANLAADPGLRAVVRAGGEILERHNVPRAGFNLDAFLRARSANPANRPRIIIPA